MRDPQDRDSSGEMDRESERQGEQLAEAAAMLKSAIAVEARDQLAGGGEDERERARQRCLREGGIRRRLSKAGGEGTGR